MVRAFGGQPWNWRRGGFSGFAANLGAGYVIDALGFAPIFVACGLLYPVGFGIVLVAVRRAQVRQ
jgi:hypothetical protein